MAFKDLSIVLYEGSIKLDYKDKAHRYYARERVNYDLPEDDKNAWGKIIYPKGTTTLMGDTLEKKGLMTWTLGMAMKELFGFYDFIGDDGVKRVGFSKGVGTIWNVKENTPEELLPIVSSANKAWTRHQKKGGDIGTITHQAIEAFILEQPFDIAEQYLWNIKENTDIDSPEYGQAMIDFDEDIRKANLAFNKFVEWWTTENPVLHNAEELLYSKEYNISGTYDGFITINGKKVLADWKTSNASKAAQAPEGVYYSYFIQLAIYELIRREMGLEQATDLLCVSVRKDSNSSFVYASELGLTMEELLDWAKAVILCYRLADKTKKALVKHAESEQ